MSDDATPVTFPPLDLARLRAARGPAYALAPDGIFASFQGEGALCGVPMVFLRSAGCGIGCDLCDTDYRVAERVDIPSIVERIESLPSASRVWITGGEPTDRDLLPLLKGLHSPYRRWVGLATAGHRRIDPEWRRWIDWLSVSPHDHAAWEQRDGDELKIVPGLGAARLADFGSDPDCRRFAHRYAQPCHSAAESLAECMAFVRENSGWRLGCQAHRDSWGMP